MCGWCRRMDGRWGLFSEGLRVYFRRQTFALSTHNRKFYAAHNEADKGGEKNRDARARRKDDVDEKDVWKEKENREINKESEKGKEREKARGEGEEQAKERNRGEKDNREKERGGGGEQQTVKGGEKGDGSSERKEEGYRKRLKRVGRAMDALVVLESDEEEEDNPTAVVSKKIRVSNKAR